MAPYNSSFWGLLSTGGSWDQTIHQTNTHQTPLCQAHPCSHQASQSPPGQTFSQDHPIRKLGLGSPPTRWQMRALCPQLQADEWSPHLENSYSSFKTHLTFHFL